MRMTKLLPLAVVALSTSTTAARTSATTDDSMFFELGVRWGR
jgi:hypothetical protein